MWQGQDTIPGARMTTKPHTILTRLDQASGKLERRAIAAADEDLAAMERHGLIRRTIELTEKGGVWLNRLEGHEQYRPPNWNAGQPR